MVISSESAEQVSGRTALQLGDVFACVRAVVNAVISCPLRCYRDTEAGRVPMTGGLGPALLARPQPGQTQAQLIARCVQHFMLWGEILVGKIRDGDGRVTQLEALDPSRVVKRIDQGQPLFDYYAPLGPVFSDLGVGDVCHIFAMVDPATGIRGASPISLCREATGLAASLTTAASALWANGAVPAGILSVPAGTGAEEQIGVLADTWARRHQGPGSRGRVAVVAGDLQMDSR